MEHSKWLRALICMLGLISAAQNVRCASAEDSLATTLGGKYGLEADVEAQGKPIAFEVSTGAWYSYIYRADPSRLWDGLYVKAGGLLSLNPAYGQLSAYLEWMPIAVLQLHMQVDRFAFFGREGSLLSYVNPKGPFGYGDHGSRRGQEKPGAADRLLLQPTLQAEVGQYLVINEATSAFYHFEQRGPYFWEQEYDTLLKKDDRIFADEFAVLYNFAPKGQEEKFLIGPTFGVVRASGADLTRKRLGLSFYRETKSHRSFLGSIAHPRFYFQVGVNSQDRNLQNQLYVEGGSGADFDLD